MIGEIQYMSEIRDSRISRKRTFERPLTEKLDWKPDWRVLADRRRFGVKCQQSTLVPSSAT